MYVYIRVWLCVVCKVTSPLNLTGSLRTNTKDLIAFLLAVLAYLSSYRVSQALSRPMEHAPQNSIGERENCLYYYNA